MCCCFLKSWQVLKCSWNGTCHTDRQRKCYALLKKINYMSTGKESGVCWWNEESFKMLCITENQKLYMNRQRNVRCWWKPEIVYKQAEKVICMAENHKLYINKHSVMHCENWKTQKVLCIAEKQDFMETDTENVVHLQIETKFLFLDKHQCISLKLSQQRTRAHLAYSPNPTGWHDVLCILWF